MSRYDPHKHHRRSMRVQGYEYAADGYYFVTICVERGECSLGEVVEGEMVCSEYGRIAEECWLWLEQRYGYVSLDEWSIMPNHLHGIVVYSAAGRGGSRTALTGRRKPLGRLIGAFKTVSTKRINEARDTPGARFWQRNYWEHIIRNERALNAIREYTRNNPLRWGADKLHPDAALNPFNEEWKKVQL